MCQFLIPEELFNTESKVIVIDFSGGAEIYDGLEEKLAGLEIGVLGKWNNLGLYFHLPVSFQHCTM